ncbi:telethonin isoform X1 [Danio rerio]|uniref:Telethonin isoform X1 n=24 Tax=Danio rerio TaxID=7955 RepID=A0A8M9P8J3_DANRE|nr:telethonin-like isoform X1 [Danio rerio]XP_005173586.1 telethonin-like isoform X1 [Danio rerio]XP_021322680.1 telethonin-like isoform X1 [Danio rerio]XP_021322681.1 telethonin-like isoform X1 [Danio rerio]XP_021322683.1 telethonin-like isoform X1 [Danio rerio]|eukprot:XP_001923715.1 telethonin-like isoform X1 [Danio rerio]
MHCLSRTPRSYLLNSYSDLQETDELSRESYEATWLDLLMETRPEYKMTLAEKDSMKKESYESKQVVHFTVRRFPNQTIQMGRDREPMQEYRLPYKNILPIPIFVPRDVTQPDVTRSPSPSVKSSTDTEASLSGVCLHKREISSITEHKPMVIQPRSPDFRASSLISPPRDTLRFQRRE